MENNFKIILIFFVDFRYSCVIIDIQGGNDYEVKQKEFQTDGIIDN